MAQLHEFWGGLKSLGQGANKLIDKGVNKLGQKIGQGIGAAGEKIDNAKNMVTGAVGDIKKTYNAGEVGGEVKHTDWY
jgi:hypothetical protein